MANKMTMTSLEFFDQSKNTLRALSAKIPTEIINEFTILIKTFVNRSKFLFDMISVQLIRNL